MEEGEYLQLLCVEEAKIYAQQQEYGKALLLFDDI